MKVLYRIARTLFGTLLKAFFHFRVYGRENLPRGKAIIAANHQSYVDPPVISAAIPEEIFFLARDDLFKLGAFRWLCRKVNSIMIKKRRADRSALRTVLEKLGEGRKVVVFPEGTRSSDGQLQPPESGVSLLAHRSRAPVIPAYVSGTYHVLPRGRKMVRFHPVSVSFGKALGFDERSLNSGAKAAYHSFSQQVMNAIAALKTSLEAPAQ